MPYTVLARKYRPQTFEQVVGQRAVVQTLQNALRLNRVAHAFLFAGPRGVGKTTTARILARALNCVRGPTPEPCGACEACRDIADGRSIDVLEIDAASNTGVDNVREVIINGISIAPARDRHKIFIIDEVHMLSGSAFNALLKTLEEPPPHAFFILATTELHKIPDTILSRCQEFDFRAISTKEIIGQLREIAKAEQLSVEDEALALVARAAEGSLRDAQSALDQVLAFSGERITQEDVAAVLGLVGRDLVLEIATAVSAEDAAAIFTLVDRAVSAGYDLRVVCRELLRLVRDLLVLKLDQTAAAELIDGGGADALRVRALADRFSPDDLLRAFDLLARTEGELRYSPQPRYYLEMTLLKWLHLRKLVPLGELIARLEGTPGARSQFSLSPSAGAAPGSRQSPAGASRGNEAPRAAFAAPAGSATTVAAASHPVASGVAAPRVTSVLPPSAVPGDGAGRDAILEEIGRAREPFYRMVVQQARTIELDGDRLVFKFAPRQDLFKEKVDHERDFLEQLASRIVGRPVRIVAEMIAPGHVQPADASGSAESSAELRDQVLKDPAVQSLLDVFHADIRSVEKLE